MENHHVYVGTKPSAQPQKHVLVVEDDSSLKPFWTHIIANHLYNLKIDWAVSGETAIETIRASPRAPAFDIVILDIFLSGTLTGLDVMNEIKNSSWGDRCEVVLSSICDVYDLKKNFFPLDTKAKFLTKPYEVSKCISTLTGALARLESRSV